MNPTPQTPSKEAVEAAQRLFEFGTDKLKAAILMTAYSKQRAEAFLCVKGKWKE